MISDGAKVTFALVGHDILEELLSAYLAEKIAMHAIHDMPEYCGDSDEIVQQVEKALNHTLGDYVLVPKTASESAIDAYVTYHCIDVECGSPEMAKLYRDAPRVYKAMINAAGNGLN